MRGRLHILLILIIFTTIMVAQTQRMRIHLQSGSVIMYDVAKLDSIDFVVVDDGDIDENVDTLYVDPEHNIFSGEASDITCYTADITSGINKEWVDDNTSQKIGILLTTESIPYQENSKFIESSIAMLDNEGGYIINLDDLVPLTSYRYRACYFDGSVWWYGQVRSFTTKSQGVSFVTYDVGSVTCFSAKSAAVLKIDPDTDYDEIEYGICYGRIEEPTIENAKAIASERDIEGNYSVMLTKLSGATEYYYRPYAVIDGYINYGAVGVFTTKEDDVVYTGTMDDDSREVCSRLEITGGPYTSLKPGVCYSMNVTPTLHDDDSVDTDEIDFDTQTYMISLANLTKGTWYYRAYVMIDSVVHYGDIKRMNADTKMAVDLGVSVKWASCNVGAASPIDYGDYFAWGEKNPKKEYSWTNYEWVDADNMISKYCTNTLFGAVDNLTKVERCDDAASACWEDDWRMPTLEEMNELKNNCYWQWNDNYAGTGVCGYAVYKAKNELHKGQTNVTNPGYDVHYSVSDIHIFLPASGYKNNDGTFYVEQYGYYWTVDLNESKQRNAWSMRFIPTGIVDYSRSRNTGCSIRAVHE